MTPAELLSLRQQYSHLDSYLSWKAAGEPCDARDWPCDEGDEVVQSNVVSGGGKGYANVTQRRGNKKRNRNRRW